MLIAQATSCHQAGRCVEAEGLYQRILALDDGCVDALNGLGTLQLQNGRLQEGVLWLEKSLTLNPRQPGVQMNIGNALRGLGRLAEALAVFERVLSMEPNLAAAYFDRGNVLNDLMRPEEALSSYDRAIALKPDYIQAYFNRGNTLKALGRLEEALTSYDRAIALQPNYAEAYYNRGYVLNDLRRFDEALANCDRVVALMPNFADAHYNRGNALQELGRYAEAVDSYDRALSLNPNASAAFNNRGNALRQLKRFEEALVCYEKAIAFSPDFAGAYNNLGGALLVLGRYEEAQVSFARSMALEPDLPHVAGAWLHCKMQCCDWAGLEVAIDRVTSAVARSEKSSHPFFLLATPSDPNLQRRCAEIYIRDKYPMASSQLWLGEVYTHDRIRIGYISADFHNHATAHLVAELIERHDRSKFEIIGISFGPVTDDAWQQRVRASFDRYFEVSERSDHEIAALIRGLEIDIAVDLKGHTQEARTGVFALRPAPVQVNYLGYPGTMGAEYYDYVIADPVVIAQDHQQYYSEKIVYLPDTYQVNDSKKRISERQFTRAELGLADSVFVFCCFNNNYKLTPDLFDVWMLLLGSVDDSVLWLLGGSEAAINNLRSEAMRRGVSSDRLVFAPRMGLDEHLARHRQADLFLDTFYYNAHTTASDALWSGLPVLTCLGGTFAGRVAASLLNAIGLPELITGSREEYTSRAIELATRPELLSAIRRKLAAHRETRPLFDTARFTRHLEAAYTEMYRRCRSGLMPESIQVVP